MLSISVLLIRRSGLRLLVVYIHGRARDLVRYLTAIEKGLMWMAHE